MKIEANRFNNQDVRISLSAESSAENYQMEGIMKQLNEAGADWESWADEEGSTGICIMARLEEL